MMRTGQLQVWWIPQIPMKPYIVDVESVREGKKIMEVLAEYDAFQYQNKVKPDYCNAGGIRMWVEDCDGAGTPGWEEWEDDDWQDEDNTGETKNE